MGGAVRVLASLAQNFREPRELPCSPLRNVLRRLFGAEGKRFGPDPSQLIEFLGNEQVVEREGADAFY